MRALFWGLLIAAALWAGYWVVGSQALARSTAQWFAAQSAAGNGARAESIAVRGFPNRCDLTVSGLNLADPNSGFGWQAPFVQVFAMTWKPWHLIAAFAPEQRITTPRESLALTTTGMRGSLQLTPGPDLALNRIVLEASAPGLRSDLGWALSADRLVMSAETDPARPLALRIGLSVLGLAPDGAVMARLQGQPDLRQSDFPAKIDDIHLDATALLSAPLDRHASQTAPVLKGLTLREARLLWGGLQIFATGDLQARADGLAEGSIALRIKGWRRLPAILLAAGLVKPGIDQTIARALEVLAEGGPDPETLEVALVMAAGQMRIGPVPLGPAPRLH